jgi:CHAD domain-containing protein
MKYRLKHREPLDAGIQRTVKAIVARIVSDLRSPDIDRSTAIHNARRGCKIIRGLFRLVKSGIKDDFESVDTLARDAAARFSGLRDADMVSEALNQLRKTQIDSMPEDELTTIQHELVHSIKNVENGHRFAQQQVDAFLADMDELVLRITSLRFRKSLARRMQSEFTKSYARALHAMTETFRMPADENLHRWRKYVKQHEYQLRFLKNYWNGKLDSRLVRLVRLAELLGDDHDLAVIQQRLMEKAKREETCGHNAVNAVSQVIPNRRAKLQGRSKRLGKRLFRKRPSQFVKRLRRL